MCHNCDHFAHKNGFVCHFSARYGSNKDKHFTHEIEGSPLIKNMDFSGEGFNVEQYTFKG